MVGISIGGALGALAEVIAGPILEDFIEGAGYYMRLWISDKMGKLDDIIWEAFSVYHTAEPEPVIGITPYGFYEVIRETLYAVAKMSMILSGEVSEELFTEMVQEGFSNAIQTSVGGAFQTMLNIWRGSAPPSPDELDVLTAKVVDLDEDTFTLLVAMTGSNLITTAVRLSKGFDDLVDNETRIIREQLLDVLNRANQVLSWIYEESRRLGIHEFEESLYTIKEIYEKGIRMLDEIAERALSRLQELKTECETAMRWLEYSQQYPDRALITYDLALRVSIENRLEAEATYNSYLSMKNYIEMSLQGAELDMQDIVNKINEIVYRYVKHLNNMVKAGIISFSEELQKIQNAYEKLTIYRNAVLDVAKPWSPVLILGEDTGELIIPYYYVTVYTIEKTE